ncbi:hypothetical protein KSC_054350 [Ktedonobacter sp. SOSP1-52]|uniref:ribbon-helix-helix domain-containing protein n=1 Tax=Ktedonobacter sp. SOSP1-52 TaxID=2778366 RepID=UPI0019167375|nr:ribbon-helix-helix domain-containing protein [Ktedonobacter sp. SOSP1-52]GHO66543.1 hypothetical protein KSC_054350 [Ktedonobacter sp. SOSP1-52]
MKTRAPLTFNTNTITNTETGLRENTQTPNRANTKPRKHKNTKGREGRQFIAAHVLPEAAKQFKLLSVQQGETVQKLLIEAINDFFAKYGLSRIADE